MRNLRVRFLAGAAAAFLALHLARPAAATMTYTVTDIGSFVGGTGTVAFAINNTGQIVGWGDTSSVDFMGNPADNAFIYKASSLIDLGTLGGDNSYSYGINGAGQAVGASHTGAYDYFGSPIFHAFLYNKTGPLQDLGTLGGDNSYGEAINAFGTFVGQSDTAAQNSIAFVGSKSGLSAVPGLGTQGSEAFAINSHGQIVGQAYTASYDPQAFLYSGGMITNLGVFAGGQQSAAFSITDNGFIVGSADVQNFSDPTSPYSHACLFNHGSLTDLGTLGGNRSGAYGVNVFQQIVGYADRQSTGNPQAFIYQNGVIQNLNDMVPTGTALHLDQANAINNSGQIVGYGSLSSGATHGFLLTPFLMLQPAYVPGGATSTATITLDAAAPPTGALVTISSSSPTLALPSTALVTIPAGKRMATFTITTAAVTTDTTVQISATYNGVTRTAPLLIRAPATLSGFIYLEQCVHPGGQTINLTFRDTDDSGSFTRTVTLASDSSFSLPNVPAGTYYLAVKGRIWLQKVVPLDAPDGGTPTISVSLLTGDANNDNSVDSSDFGILINAYGGDSSISGSGYDIRADFNCDGVVDSSDFGLLIGNFNTLGDP